MYYEDTHSKNKHIRENLHAVLLLPAVNEILKVAVLCDANPHETLKTIRYCGGG